MAKVFLLAFTLLCACQKPLDEPARPFTVRLISSVDDVYELKDVTIESLASVTVVAGTYGQLRGNASLNVEDEADEVIASVEPARIYNDRGGNVITDYTVKNGIIIPQNFQTMEMLGLYYNIERTAAFWEEHFQLDYAATALPGIFYNPKMSKKSGGVTEEVAAVMNAAYLPGVRDLWFFRTSPRENIPVKMNFSVVAHEFGHFIFDYRFADFDPEFYATSQAINERFISGLNEGLADYFAFMVTGTPSGFKASLPDIDKERSLPVPWNISNPARSGCTGGFYCDGSVIASALYEIAITAGQSPIEVGRIAYEVLPAFGAVWRDKRNVEKVDYGDFLALLIAASGPHRALYCEVMTRRFDLESIRAKLLCT